MPEENDTYIRIYSDLEGNDYVDKYVDGVLVERTTSE